jgi:hypothetical protein
MIPGNRVGQQFTVQAPRLYTMTPTTRRQHADWTQIPPVYSQHDCGPGGGDPDF